MKRFITLLCIFAICISLFAVPVFAAYSWDISLIYRADGEYLLGLSLGTPLSVPGNYLVDISMGLEGEPFVTLHDLPVDFDLLSGSTYSGVIPSTSADFTAWGLGVTEVRFDFIYLPEDSYSSMRCDVYLIFEGEEVALLPDNMELSFRSPDTPIENVSGGLEAAIFWIGSVIQALMNGSLSGLLPVLAVAISVSGIVLTIKLIRSFGWGM